MDPDSALAELLTLAGALLDRHDTHIPLDLARLAELVHALDGWLTTGGYLPARWDAGRGRR